ncbi:Uncharacterized protein Adt_28111 [Abeliophyllum distichum]|uniref:Uncharacterized protein n=1 Tax=Abeliophyllum distichum TaxID=126358 RepID=A0ABD1RVM0_9LAMI
MIQYQKHGRITSVMSLIESQDVLGFILGDTQQPPTEIDDATNTNKSCKRRGHEALKCWYRFDNSYQEDEILQALAAFHLNELPIVEWLPDTGATAHNTDDFRQPLQCKAIYGI